MNFLRLFHKKGFLLLTCCLIIGFTACNTGKKISEKTTTEETEKPTVEKPSVYLNHKMLYKTFSGRGNLHIVTPEFDKKVTAYLSMDKDRDILASIRALGMLEVARAFATPDSLFLLNRLQKTAYALDYHDGIKLIKAEVPFASLQNLIAGSPLLPDSATIKNMIVKGDRVIITRQTSEFIEVLEYDLKTQVLKRLHLSALDRPFEFTINYGDYRKIGIGQPFAFDRNIKIQKAGKNMTVDLNFTQATIDYPVNTNFRIPGSYSVLDTVK